jgi:hypothetical protein
VYADVDGPRSLVRLERNPKNRGAGAFVYVVTNARRTTRGAAVPARRTLRTSRIRRTKLIRPSLPLGRADMALRVRRQTTPPRRSPSWRTSGPLSRCERTCDDVHVMRLVQTLDLVLPHFHKQHVAFGSREWLHPSGDGWMGSPNGRDIALAVVPNEHLDFRHGRLPRTIP